MKKLTSQEIVERLTETFAKEGLRFTGIEVVGNAGDLQADEFTAGAPENTDGQNARLGGERSNQEPLEERGRSFGSAAVSGGSRVQVRIRLERFAPGLPTAFMVKGLQGTFRRYYDPDTDVILEEYKVLSQAEGAKPCRVGNVPLGPVADEPVLIEGHCFWRDAGVTCLCVNEANNLLV